MTTRIECPDCGVASRPDRPLPAGSPAQCPECGALFMAPAGDRRRGASWPRYPTPLSDGQVLATFAAIGLALVTAYGVGQASMTRPRPPETAETDGSLRPLPVPQPVPKGPGSPEDVERAARTTADPALRLALVEERRVVFRDSPTTQDCSRLLETVSRKFKLGREDAAGRILEAVRAAEGEGDRLGPLRILDAADVYTHSPRFHSGRADFDSFLAGLDEALGPDKNRTGLLERIVRLR